MKALGAADLEACRWIRELILERFGVQIRDGKEALIQARLGKRLRHHRLPDLRSYCDFLRRSRDAAEWTHVVDALTTNFTHFLREGDHFRFLVETALPELSHSTGAEFHLWSAACSSGEEPYSIAMFLAEQSAAHPALKWSITATDLSKEMLAKARQGIYSGDKLKDVPHSWLHKYFQKGMGAWEGQFRVKAALAGRIQFQPINLTERYTFPHRFSVVFLRNVMIYFDRPKQEEMVNYICRFLEPRGYLLIGHSETLNGMNVPLRCVSPSIYQSTKTNA